MYALIDIVDTYKVESVDSVDIAIHMRSIIIIELCARQHYLHYITLYHNTICPSKTDIYTFIEFALKLRRLRI